MWADCIDKSLRPEIVYYNRGLEGNNPWHWSDFLLVKFPNDIHLEVCWDDDNDCYSVNLTKNNFKTIIKNYKCITKQFILDSIKEISQFLLEEKNK